MTNQNVRQPLADIPVSDGGREPRSEAEIQLLLKLKHAELKDDAKLAPQVKHYQKPEEKPFTQAQRDSTTILFGGLTWKHEQLIQAFTRSLGYQFVALPVPDIDAFQTGKEFGNNGQCNPSYFTVGNLVEYLKNLEQSGLSRRQIIDQYVFITAGSCGPCRFGMYESEYRLALENSGFDGFRILLFQQTAGLFQDKANAGINLNSRFFVGLLNALVLGDLLNEVAYKIRPFEVNAGETDLVLKQSLDVISNLLSKPEAKNKPWYKWVPGAAGYWFQLIFATRNLTALEAISNRFDAIEVDFLRVKPVVKITGEFWAQTTEGDGNYRMFSFLEQENAQVLVEPIGTWISYILHQAKQKAGDERGLATHRFYQIFGHFQWLSGIVQSRWKEVKLSLAEYLFNRQWNHYCRQLRHIPHPLLDQSELTEIAQPFYNSRAQGGEGHLEIAKNIYYTQNKLCHMVLSLKPFGCMPSTQSDGVQSAIVNRFHDMIFLPLETSGEGEVNAHSRAQMALGEARIKSNDEFEAALKACRHSLAQIRKYVNQHRELRGAMLNIPSDGRYSGQAANYVRYVDTLMRESQEKPERD